MQLARTILLLAVVSTFATGARAAPGVNLRWDHCLGDGGVQNRNFACNTNSGNQILVCSFVLGTAVAQVTGQEMVIDFAADDATYPAWWSFKNVGTCRQNSMGLNLAGPAGDVTCEDWASGAAVGAIASYAIGDFAPNLARLRIASAVPMDALMDLSAGIDYFAALLSINNLKTVGTGACGGCSVPVCIVSRGVTVTTLDPRNNVVVHGPTNGVDGFFATWQGGGNPVVGPSGGCPHAIPTRRSTFGELKSLYR